MEHCSWTNKHGQQPCLRPATHNGFCIFHAPVGKSEEAFDLALARYVQDLQSVTSEWDFSGFVFPRGVEARHLTLLHGGNRFTFKYSVTFAEAQFHGSAEFSKSQFNDSVDFESVHFHDAVWYVNTTFHGKCKFHFAEFFAPWAETGRYYTSIDLSYCTFALGGEFHDCIFWDRAELKWPGQGHKRRDNQITPRGRLILSSLHFGDNATLDLRDNSLSDDSKLRIERCDMGRILIEGTDCTKVEFYDCTWPKYRGRSVVGDELIEIREWKRWGIRSSVRWDLFRITYQQLAKRFREDFDHVLANDFDRGQFEMRRLMPP